MEQEEFKHKIVSLREQLLLYAKRFLENTEEAEDIIQEVFLKLWRIRHELHRYDNLHGLCVCVTKNLCLNRIRSIKRELESQENYPEITDHFTPHLQLERKDDMEKVMMLIEQLPGSQQEILRMKHFEELDVKEISELTGATPEAIRMNLSRARKKIRDQFLNPKL